MIYRNIRKRMSEEQIRRRYRKPQLFWYEFIIPEGFGRCWGVLALPPAPPKPFLSIEWKNILLGMVEVCAAANADELCEEYWGAAGKALCRSCDWPIDFMWQITLFADGEWWVPLMELILAWEPWQWRWKEIPSKFSHSKLANLQTCKLAAGANLQTCTGCKLANLQTCSGPKLANLHLGIKGVRGVRSLHTQECRTRNLVYKKCINLRHIVCNLGTPL